MPGDDASVELQDLGLQFAQLIAESTKTCTSHFGEPVVGFIGDDLQELLDTSAPNRGNYPELGKAAAKAIPGAMLIEFPDYGHAPQMTDPEGFDKALIAGISKP